MPDNSLALALQPSDAPSDDYQALCAALSESERGRALLAEFARRNRSADTAMLLAAIERIEARLRADGAAVERLRDDLRMLLITIRLMRPEIDSAGPAAQAVKLAQLLDLLERRIDALADARPADPEQSQLATAAAPDAPELPVPAPARFASPLLETTVVEPVTQPPTDPLAAIMALSEDERLALFS